MKADNCASCIRSDYCEMQIPNYVVCIDASAECGDMSRLHASTEMHSRQLRQTELDVRKSMQKMKDLNINIR